MEQVILINAQPQARRKQVAFLFGLALAAAGSWAVPAQAHVKWFAPYIVGATPRPVQDTLTNGWFWLAVALVLVFFIGTRLVETSSLGESVLLGMDRLARPLWSRLDDFVRAVIGAFFVAIFAVSISPPI